jgi:hypothetical protein
MSGIKAELDAAALMQRLLAEHVDRLNSTLKEEVDASRPVLPSSPPELGNLKVGNTFTDIFGVQRAVNAMKMIYNKQMLVSQSGQGNEYYQ